MARSSLAAALAQHLVATAVLLATLVLLLATPTSAQSCTSTVLSLSPCLGYTTGQSPSPSTACCKTLAGVVQNSPQCLCSLAGGSAPFGIRINTTRALALPGACNVTTPPPSACNAVGGGTPGGPTTPSTPASPTTPVSPAPYVAPPAPVVTTPPASPVVPVAGPPPNKSAATTNPVSGVHLLLLLALASAAAIF